MLLPLLAVLLTACSSGAAATPAAAVPVAAPAVTGTGTAAASVAATVGPPTPAVTLPSVEPATRVPATGPATQATPVPTPRPTPTQPAATPPPGTGEQAVSISNFAFVSATITVKVRTLVTWTNRQAGVQHTVTADDGSFGSAALSTGSSYSHVFTKAGTFTYHCAIHPFMTGTVIVVG
ncbi:MAG TPA: plastocyanin/azurin family copper-binding protein [Candidatus Baltobacteraceae bacterium]|nr:plastocyanin/azurin family copper-binding protein [Candidatus Baltobacteraceae bacterium]